MEATHCDESISQFLAGLIELGGLHKVDQTPDKFIRLIETNEVVRHNTDSASQPLAIYGTYNKDAIIINPFSEGEAKTVQATWFFSNTNTQLAMNIQAMMIKLVQLAIEANKNKGKKVESNLDLKILNLISDPIMKDVDERVLSELKTISKPVSNLFMIYYNKKTSCTEVTSILTSEVKKKAFDSKSVRVKTWTILTKLLLGLLGAQEDLEEFTYKPQTNTCRVFEGLAHVLVNIYARLKEYSPLLIGKAFDTTQLESHLNYFEPYAKTACWCHGAMVFEDKQKAPTMPTAPVPQMPVIAPLAPPLIPPMAAQPMPVAAPMPGMMPPPMGVQPYGVRVPGMQDNIVAPNPFSKI